MKTLLLLLMATTVCLAQDLNYESQKKGSAVNTKHLKAFSKIKLAHVKIKKSHFSEAIFYLSKGAEDKNKIGHFDFGIAYPVDINDSAGLFTESREEKLKYDTVVSLNKKELSILDAIDQLCKQAGYVWTITFFDDDKPFIHLEYKSG